MELILEGIIDYGYVGTIDGKKCIISTEIYDLEPNVMSLKNRSVDESISSMCMKTYSFHPLYYTKNMQISNFKYVCTIMQAGAQEVSDEEYSNCWREFKQLTSKHLYNKNDFETIEKDDLCNVIDEAIIKLMTNN